MDLALNVKPVTHSTHTIVVPFADIISLTMKFIAVVALALATVAIAASPRDAGNTSLRGAHPALDQDIAPRQNLRGVPRHIGRSAPPRKLLRQ
jgi:hypothetical protein